MGTHNHGRSGGKSRRRADTAPEAQAAAKQPKQRQQRRTQRGTARNRVGRPDVREKLKARERQEQGRVMPRGRRLLSPVAWLRWPLRRTLRPAERQF